MSESRSFQRLVEIVRRLRKECPWDREQTFESVKSCVLEETYETLEAIDGKGDLKEELGDLLLQALFLATMAEEKNLFQIEEVLCAVTDKLVRRHPHVFEEAKAENAEEVLKRWTVIKRKEKGGDGSCLDGIPSAAPALLKAYRISQKASRTGFDWPDREAVWEKCQEEWQELSERQGDPEGGFEEELGDLLFALTNLARFSKIDPEQALGKASQKFSQRFREMERMAQEEKKDLQELTAEEWDKLWTHAKSKLL